MLIVSSYSVTVPVCEGPLDLSTNTGDPSSSKAASLFSFNMAELNLKCLIFISLALCVQGIHFFDSRSTTSYARYPKWNACTDASISFEFSTTQRDGLLLYTDSGGKFDFLQVMTKSGRVNVIMNIVDEDVRLELDAGHDVSDGEWHSVTIKRNRMTTTLTVDSVSDSDTTRGTDFYFGDLANNSDVFIGGIPDKYNTYDALHELSLASALFEPRFIGSLRNIIYGNCSCDTVRAQFIEGTGMSLSPPEACTERNPCRNGCTCVSKDEGPACDCSNLDCFILERNDVTHYSLPMDTITGVNIENPSGLDATAHGSPMLIPGVLGNAIRLHTPEQYVVVSGPSHKDECFGDLDKCPNGYTLQFWVKFEHPVDGDEIFLSNGGHTDRSYGVAMLYNAGKLEFRFRRKNGETWRVEHSEVLPNRWYHLMATWSQHDGLSMYVDGLLVDADTQPEIRGSVTADQHNFGSFILGRSNEEGRHRMRRAVTHGSVAMDEFRYSSTHTSSNQVRNMGPIFRYYFPMEVLDGTQISDGRTPATLHGRPSLIKGKVGRAIRLDGRMEYIDAGEVGSECLGDLQRCQYGISIAFWINSFHQQNDMYYLDSGSRGVKVYFKEKDNDKKLVAEFQQSNRHWTLEWPNFQRNNWYFIELSWNPNDGARMYANLVQVAQDATPRRKTPGGGTSRFYIGRANTDMSNEKYAQAYIDEIEVLYADRAKCLSLGLIQRDTIQHIAIPFDVQHDNLILHELYRILVYNGAKLVRLPGGKVGKGVYMNSSSQHQQWTSIGEHQNDCFGNLALCIHGITMKLKIYPKDLRPNQYYLSAGPYSLYYKNNRLYAKFTNGTKTWTVSTSYFESQKWQDIELTWHEQRGLQMYINGRQMGTTTVASIHAEKEITDWTVYLGRPNTMITNDSNVGRANVIIDQMDLWFAHKDFIGMWPKHVRHDIIDMDRIMSGNRVEHSRHEGHNVYAINNPAVVRGWIQDAITLDGSNQYINAGPNCSCRGNLQRCYNGFTLRARIKPNQLQNGMYLFSSAAYDIYYRNGKLVASFRTPNRKWFLQTDQFSPTEWSSMEWTWHPKKGLHMFVNGKEVATDLTSSPYTGQYNMGKNFYIGRANTGMSSEKYGRFTVDDVQLWEAYREILITNGLIDPNERRPGDVRKDIIDMDRIVGNRVSHEKHRGHNVYVYNQPNVVRGWINGAVKLNGNNQYINVGQNSSCGGQLENCPHGFTLRSRVRGDNLQNGQFLYSSNMYDVYYRNGKLWCQFKTPTKTWTVSSRALNPKEWNLLEFTWHANKGLKMFVNNREVASETNSVSNTDGYGYTEPLYIGRANTNVQDYGQFTVDDVQLWEAWRQYLMVDGLIDPSTDPPAPPADVKKDIIDMDSLTGNTITHENVHRGHKVYTFNRPSVVQGWINNGVSLNGINQYLNVGTNSSCDGNLVNCPHGFTLRSRIKPKNLIDNMYIHSSSQYDIYYHDNKIVAEFHTPNHTWRVSSNSFKDLDWNLMEWTWHADHGLIMYVNNREVARSTTKMPPKHIYDYNKKYYIGRANTDMSFEKYGQFVVDDVQLWEAWRPYLLEEGLIDPRKDPKPPVGDVRKDVIDMDRISGNKVVHISHPGHNVFIRNMPRNVRGWFGNAVRLNSAQRQFIDLGANATCQGDLTRCHNGFTLRSRLKPGTLSDNQYWYSSAPYDIYYSGGKVHAVFRTPTHVWRVSTDQFNQNDWNLFDFSWHADEGLIMWVNGQKVASDRRITPNTDPYDPNQIMYIGKNRGLENYGDFTIDDVQLWEAKRALLIQRRLINATDPRDAVTLPPTTTTTTTTPTPAPEHYMMFDGTNWILYNMAGVPAEQRQKSDTEEIMIEFRTTVPDGLIWWAGVEDRNMHLSLRNGQLVLIADHGGSNVDRFRVTKPQGRLSDGEWHKVIVTRHGKNVIVNIDGLEDDKTLSHEPSIVTNGAILIGGYENSRTITDKRVNGNLDGYVKQMYIESDHILRMDLFNLFETRPRPPWVVPNGLLPDNAKSRPKPITFKQRGAHIKLPKYEGENEGVISFKFRTTEPNGLLLYNGGARGVPDFFSVEMYDGEMHYIINTGAGVYRFPFPEAPVNDGKPHHAKIVRSGNDVVLYMDGEQQQYPIPGSNNERLNLDSFLYVGAVDVANRLPWHLWTRQEKYYLGCLWDLEMNNGRPVDLEHYVAEQHVRGISSGCEEREAGCLHNPCAHGRCIDTWNEALCDCAGTVYNGERCEHFADVATFDGIDFLHLRINPMLQTHTNDVSLRFKTGKENGLLFATDNNINHEYIKALIENGHGKLRTNLGGRERVLEFGRDLADDEWHTLYIKRRANELEVWIDENDKFSTRLPGLDWTWDIDKLMVASAGEDDTTGNFAGWMQNFYFNGYDILDPPGEWGKDGDPPVGPTGKPIPENAVTLTHPLDSFATLNTLQAVEDMEVSFMFKTKDADGLLMYNGGNNNQFIAVELHGGYVHLVLNDGGETRIYRALSERLNDNGWHFVKIKRVGYTFTIVVDQAAASYSSRTKRQGDQVDLTGTLYIGGMPRNLYNRLPFEVQSRRGFRGCLASFKIGGRLYDLLRDSVFVSTYVKQNCTSTGQFCHANPCKNNGICLDGVSTYICDCNMTAYVGRICTDEPEGYRYGEKYRPGYYDYNYDDAWSSKRDSLALGFMTWFENGTIARIESENRAEYIELKMVNGHVVAEYNIGGGIHHLVEDRRKFNDGGYHVVVFQRSEENATLRVDSYPVNKFISSGDTGVKLFNEVIRVNVGGIQKYLDERRLHKYAFNGIIAGLYFNGLRVLDSGIIDQSIHGQTHGDVILAKHRFFLAKPRIPTATPPDGGGDNGKKEIIYTPTEVPLENSGGGAVWSKTHGGDGGSTIVQPGGGGAGAINVGNGPYTGGLKAVPPYIVGGPAEGGRAAAFAGTFIGALLLASSLVYALYKLKPGQLPCLGAGGAGKGGPVISAPSAHENTKYHVLGSGGGAASKVEVANGGAATGTGISMASFGTQTLEHGASAGGANSQTKAFNDYFSSIQQTSTTTAVGQENGTGGGYGTMTRAIQTDYQQADGGQALANNYDQQTLNQRTLNQQTLNQQQQQQQQQQFNSYTQESNSYSALDSYQTSSYMQQNTNTMQNDNSGGWQMQTMPLGSGAQTMPLGSGAQNLATLAAEEIRVDCLLMTSDGQHVVTGSIYGPPQAWDLSSGELVRIMSGEELSSTDLHLACKDTLLVGQVAEMTQVDPGDPQATSRIHNRKLQIWDFLTGRPLEMEKNELCTASCMMADGERIVLGRTEKFGGGTTIVIYDLLANEPVRTLRYEAAVGFADFISYLNLSKDNRYVIAGFQNSYDGNANFIIFDLTADSYSNPVEPKLLALDASAECTAVLDNHEAVTGTRNGELLIWSMRTGKPLRQLVSATGGTTMTRMGVNKAVAHAKEVKAVSVSRDGKLLISASADCTIKVWNLDSERQITTLKGHTDEIWCCTISDDNDIVVSGSCDGTIRLWRLSTATPICVYNTGVDVFSVRMSSNKRTIVALGDKYGARKLIMLRVVITKTRSRAPSRATSPIHMGSSRPTSPYRATSPLIR